MAGENSVTGSTEATGWPRVTPWEVEVVISRALMPPSGGKA